MSKFFVPANDPEDWKNLLAKPDRHWRTGYSAKALAYCWQEVDGFPLEVKYGNLKQIPEGWRNGR